MNIHLRVMYGEHRIDTIVDPYTCYGQLGQTDCCGAMYINTIDADIEKICESIFKERVSIVLIEGYISTGLCDDLINRYNQKYPFVKMKCLYSTSDEWKSTFIHMLGISIPDQDKLREAFGLC